MEAPVGRFAPRARRGCLRLDAPGIAPEGFATQPPADLQRRGDQLVLTFRDAVPAGARVQVDVEYRARPERGLTRSGAFVVGAHHTSHWVPCLFDPSDQAQWTVRIEGVDAIQFGQGAAPPHMVAFAVGPFARLVRGDITLLAPAAAPEAQAALLLERALAAEARLTRELGPPPGPWTLVAAPGAPGQELVGGAIIPSRTLEDVTRTPDEDWLVVHELAHRWFGEQVGIASWGDLWIQEGIAVWLVARDKELRELGRGDHPTGLASPGYAREVSLWRQRLDAALAREGVDPRLYRPGVRAEEAGGSVVYHRGALALHTLRTTLGPGALIRWLRALLSTHRGRYLSTEELVGSLPSHARGVVSDCILARQSRCADQVPGDG